MKQFFETHAINNKEGNAAPLDCLLTFDVEEYFQIEAARGVVSSDEWNRYESRVEGVMDWLLETLDTHQTRATFFVLGWIARKYPQMVRRIAELGHEIASHGDMHDRLHRLTPESFREDMLRSKLTLEDITSCSVRGYRAPTFSLMRETEYAVDVLIEAGFEYDSSVQPIRHPHYGVYDAPVAPYLLHGRGGGRLLEIPPLCYERGRMRLPVAGGGYFRLFPLGVMNAGIRRARAELRPAMLYFHPWEFDEHQPRLPLKGVNRFRTYVGLKRTRRRLEALLKRWHCGAVEDWMSYGVGAQMPGFSLAA